MQELDLIFCLGQSNMVGFESDAADLGYDERTVQSWQIPYYGLVDSRFSRRASNWQIYNLHSGRARQSRPNQLTFGLELGAIEFLRANHRQPAIIKIATCGTNLAGKNGAWNSQHDGFMWQKFYHACAHALASFADFAPQKKLRPRGILWMQGESDSDNFSSAQNYQRDLTALIMTMRARINEFFASEKNLPVIMGKIAAIGVGEFALQISAAQQQICQTLANARLIDCADLERQADLVHFTSAASLRLGKRFAKQLHENFLS